MTLGESMRWQVKSKMGKRRGGQGKEEGLSMAPSTHWRYPPPNWQVFTKGGIWSGEGEARGKWEWKASRCIMKSGHDICCGSIFHWPLNPLKCVAIRMPMARLETMWNDGNNDATTASMMTTCQHFDGNATTATSKVYPSSTPSMTCSAYSRQHVQHITGANHTTWWHIQAIDESTSNWQWVTPIKFMPGSVNMVPAYNQWWSVKANDMVGHHTKQEAEGRAQWQNGVALPHF